MSAYQCVLRTNKIPYNVFDKHDLRFSELWNTLDTDGMCQVIRKQGVGAEVSHAPVVSYEHGMLMWKNEVLGFEPLIRAVFVTVGMYFSLRGGQEHYDLKSISSIHTVLV